MEFNQISRLFGKTNDDLIFCEQKITNWTKFMSDYKALEERLSTLADKTRHEVMVPVGGSNLAFMDGYIKHTNEILVLLGDNYFVERSAKQAKEMVERRLTKCQHMIEELNKEKTSLQQWLSVSQQFSKEKTNEDFVEIFEPFDEQKEKQWKEDHKRRVKEYKLSQKSQNEDSKHLEVMNKLEKLEIEENKSQKQELKSILKNPIKKESDGRDKSVAFNDSKQEVLVSNREETNRFECSDGPIDEQTTDKPFKNEIKEREIDNELNEIKVEMNSSPKIVSRFKANRMKK